MASGRGRGIGGAIRPFQFIASRSCLSATTTRLETALAHASRLLGQDPALAGEQAREILRVVPGHPAARLVLGAAHRLQGEGGSALEVLAPLAGEQPGAAHVHYELGLARGQMGQLDEAIAALREAVRLKPDLAQAWLALADRLRESGDDSGAAAANAAYLRHSARDPRLLQAADALAQNRLEEADERLTAWLEQRPTDVAAMRMQAELRVRLGWKDGRWILVTDAWFFKEGEAPRFEPARFGEFRVDADGQALLVGLRDATLRPL